MHPSCRKLTGTSTHWRPSAWQILAIKVCRYVSTYQILVHVSTYQGFHFGTGFLSHSHIYGLAGLPLHLWLELGFLYSHHPRRMLGRCSGAIFTGRNLQASSSLDPSDRRNVSSYSPKTATRRQNEKGPESSVGFCSIGPPRPCSTDNKSNFDWLPFHPGWVAQFNFRTVVLPFCGPPL